MARGAIMSGNELHLEISDKDIDKGMPVLLSKTAVFIFSPPLNEDYWIFRVMLHKDQAVVGFPKHSGIGIGFAQEEHYNVNLPYRCDAAMIYDHIEENKRYDEITKEQCIQAIRLIQAAAERYQQSQ
jgi:hypothetical protein